MVLRFSQKYGDDAHSLKVINECLGTKLKDREKIEAKDFDDIQDEVKRRLAPQNRGGPSREHQQALAGSVNKVRSLSALRSHAYPIGEQPSNNDGRAAPNRRAQTKLLQSRSRALNAASRTQYDQDLDSLS